MVPGSACVPPSPAAALAIPQRLACLVVEQNVVRLDVPMNHPFAVGIGERLGELREMESGFLLGDAALPS